jgi:hypothetical protein
MSASRSTGFLPSHAAGEPGNRDSSLGVPAATVLELFRPRTRLTVAVFDALAGEPFTARPSSQFRERRTPPSRKPASARRCRMDCAHVNTVRVSGRSAEGDRLHNLKARRHGGEPMSRRSSPARTHSLSCARTRRMRQHLKHRLAAPSDRVDPLLGQEQVNSEGVQLRQEGHGVLQASAEPIDRPGQLSRPAARAPAIDSGPIRP